MDGSFYEFADFEDKKVRFREQVHSFDESGYTVTTYLECHAGIAAAMADQWG